MRHFVTALCVFFALASAAMAANELILPGATAQSGQTVYALLANTGSYALAAGGIQPYSAASWPDYALMASESGLGSFMASVPSSVPAGQYAMRWFVRAGGTPATTDREIGTGPLIWSGSNETTLGTVHTKVSVLPTTNAGSVGGIPLVNSGAVLSVSTSNVTDTAMTGSIASTNGLVSTGTMASSMNALVASAASIAGSVTNTYGLVSTGTLAANISSMYSSLPPSAAGTPGGLPQLDLFNQLNVVATGSTAATINSTTATLAGGVTVTGSVGGISGVTFPTRFSSLAIDGTGGVIPTKSGVSTVDLSPVQDVTDKLNLILTGTGYDAGIIITGTQMRALLRGR